MVVVLVVVIRGWLVRHLLTAASGLLPPLLPTADCPPKGKEEHQQTETLPVMDKNTPLHHTHQIQRVWCSEPSRPFSVHENKAELSARTPVLRWQLSGLLRESCVG